MTIDDIQHLYEDLVKDGVEPQAAAILAAAYFREDYGEHFKFTDTMTDNLAHAICMGIRKGIFGVGASDHESLSSNYGPSFSDIALAINNLADAVKELVPTP